MHNIETVYFYDLYNPSLVANIQSNQLQNYIAQQSKLSKIFFWNKE